ncbi:MAG TPA: ankyrin repeat domain-containing protein [Gallionellaceae bacterium]|nr:ankyrin repeat domain-containing protein [Gallionellaceae bacterium]
MRFSLWPALLACLLGGQLAGSAAWAQEGVAAGMVAVPAAAPDLSVATGGLAQAILEGADVTRVQALIRQGADVNTPDAQGRVPLIAAIARDDVEIAALLLDKGARIGATGPDGMPALSAAAMVGHPEMVQLLLDRGASANAQPASGMTPLAIACMAARPEVMAHFSATLSDRTEVANILLNHGADPDVRSPDGLTLLMHMAVDGPAQIAALLLERGVQANATGPKDVTALMLAAQNGNVEVLKLLLRHGANRAMKDSKGRTALDLARAAGQQAAAELLQGKAHRRPHGSIRHK